MKKSILIAFSASLAISSMITADVPVEPKAFVLPTRAAGIELKNREMLRMGERALNAGDLSGAINQFYALRNTLSKTNAKSSDYMLVSALLAETCLQFLPKTEVALNAPNTGRVNVTACANEIFQTALPSSISQEVRVYWQFVLAKWHIRNGRHPEAMEVLEGLWQLSEKTVDRLARLGDLHNWILATYMEELSVKAKSQKDESSVGDTVWLTVLSLGRQRQDLPSVDQVDQRNEADEADAMRQVSVQAGNQFQRTVRADIPICVFRRLLAYANLAVGKYADAEMELRALDVADYPLEKQLLLAISLARQDRREDVEKLLDQYAYEYFEGKIVPSELKDVWRDALWSLLEMYYKAREYSVAEVYLSRLENLIDGGEHYRWLMLQMGLQKSRLASILSAYERQSDKSEIAFQLEKLRGDCQKYNTLFPEQCQSTWLSSIRSFTQVQQQSYLQILSEVMMSLGNLENAVGNINLAMEYFEAVGKCESLPSSLRYSAYARLGEISISDYGKSIAAFRACEALPDITTVQRAEVLNMACRRALDLFGKPALTADVKAAMKQEIINGYSQLQKKYGETPYGIDAPYCLAEFYGSQNDHVNAIAMYVSYFTNPNANPLKRDTAKLKWCREQLIQAKEVDEIPNAEITQTLQGTLQELYACADKEISAQSYVEMFRLKQITDDDQEAVKLLDPIVERWEHSEAPPDVFWVALYERMNSHYRHGQFDLALKDGNIYDNMQLAKAIERKWQIEFKVLLGDIYSAQSDWPHAADIYTQVSEQCQDSNSAIYQYVMYEAAYARFKEGKGMLAKEVLLKVFGERSKNEPHYAYSSAMLLAEIAQADGDFEEARRQYMIAQDVYGAKDTFRTNLARCRQGEMLLQLAKTIFSKENTEEQRDEAFKKLMNASEIFQVLLEIKTTDAGVTVAKNHYFDLFIRTLFYLGSCYEKAMDTAGDKKDLMRQEALQCYKSICDYFIERFQQGNTLPHSEYFIKSLDKRVQLLISGTTTVSQDVMESVARLYEEYAQMGFEGALIARQRAAAIRNAWNK